MIKIFKMTVICAIGAMTLSSCLDEQGQQIYTELYSVIKSDGTGMYFSSDEGIDLFPASGFNAQWGTVGDRVVVGFYYNPYTISDETTRLNITVEALLGVQTHDSALPSTVDTVGSGVFALKNTSDKQAIVAWVAQNYLTAVFSIRYTDPAKHIFGFIEESTLFRNDTLFLSLWHNTKESGKNKTSQSHIALNLSDYEDDLSRSDSVVILLKYNAENIHSSEVENYSYPVIYKRAYNLSGY
jgi:hypothetical protein